MTCLFSATNSRASLPAVVVLPVPLTPTMMMTLGLAAPGFSALRRRSVSRPTRSSSFSLSVARTSAGSALPVMRASVLRSSTSWAEASAPTSASSSVSSTSSQSASERLSLARMSNRALPNGLPDLASFALSRVSREPTDSGVSGLAGVGLEAGWDSGLGAAAGSGSACAAGAGSALADSADLAGSAAVAALASSASAASRASAAALASRVFLLSGATLPIARSKSRLRDLPNQMLRAITITAATITPRTASTVFISIPVKSSPQMESPTNSAVSGRQFHPAT